MEVPRVDLAEVGGATAVVDAPSAAELLAEIHKRATREELDGVVADLRRKSERFARWTAPAALAEPGGEPVRRLLRHVFATRRRVAGTLGLRPAPEFGALIGALLHGPQPLERRFDAFCGALDLEPPVAAELAAELLHFSAPGTHWPWSRWMWSPDTRTGALPLVLDDDFELEADGLGATYVRVGEAVRFLDATPEAGSFRPSEGGTLGTDVFLVGVYAVYASTVLGLKLSREFNAVIPALPELARRLLGVHRMEAP